MSPVAWIDIAALVLGLAAVPGLCRPGHSRFGPMGRAALWAIVGFTVFRNVSNTLEWSGITPALDPFEDYAGLFQPLVYLFTAVTFSELAAARKIREARDRYRTLVESMDLGVTLVDRDFTVVMTNSAHGRLLGGDPASFAGSKCYRAFRRASTVCPDCPGRRAMESGEPQELEIERPGPDGQRLWLRIRAVPLQGPGGRAGGFIELVEDVTARKRAEEERRRLEARIQQAQKLESLAVLAGGIAHDFNNLLMGVLGNAELALTRLPPESPVRDLVKRIERAAVRAADLAGQMLAYSGRGQFLVEELDLNELVRETAFLLESSISRKVACRYNLAPALPPVEADPTQIRQVLMNLVTNASEAIGDREGAVTISTGVVWADRDYLTSTYLDEDLPEGFYVYVEVSDTGCGMDPETQKRIFDPFFSTKFTGRGLGLAAVLGIVRGHRGAIKVYSEPGKGSTFKVLLPCANRPGAGRRQPPPSAVGGIEWSGSGTVLVVDDEEAVRSLARTALEERGLRVLTAADGREAVDVFRRHAGEIDLVVLDMTMPGMGGEETFGELRRIRPDVRVILSSGYNEQEAVNRFAGKGLAGFLHKPYRPSELVERVRQLLEGEGAS